MMKLRLALPEHVVDLGRVPGLNAITSYRIVTSYRIAGAQLFFPPRPTATSGYLVDRSI